jgi:hypothetical protein
MSNWLNISMLEGRRKRLRGRRRLKRRQRRRPGGRRWWWHRTPDEGQSFKDVRTWKK